MSRKIFFNASGLKFKIISSLSMFFLLVFGFLIYYNINDQHNNLTREMERSGNILATNTMAAIRSPMSEGDNESIEKTFKQLKSRIKEMDFYITDNKKKVKWSTQTQSIGKDLSQQMTNPQLVEAFDLGLSQGKLSNRNAGPTENNRGFIEQIGGNPVFTLVEPILNEKSCHQCHDASETVLGAFVTRQSALPLYNLLKELTLKNILFGIAGFVLILIILYSLISRLVVNPIRKVDDLLKDIAEGEGDLTARLDVVRDDEIGEVSEWFNIFVEKIQQTIKQVISAGGDFAKVTKVIASDSSELASRSSEQAASVTETAATMEEFSQSLNEVRNSTEQVHQEIDNFNKEVNAKKELIDNVSSTMSEIDDSGRKISNIVSVINDISFQTNLLALNAAVEAARAGDAGRGFAVVASEVRILAQKTTEASKNIQEIVSQNVVSTETGMDLVAQTSEFFNSLITVMEKMLIRIQEITLNTKEQSTAVEDVTRTVSQLEEVTNKNAGLSEELSAHSTSMEDNSQRLMQLIRQFKV